MSCSLYWIWLTDVFFIYTFFILCHINVNTLTCCMCILSSPPGHSELSKMFWWGDWQEIKWNIFRGMLSRKMLHAMCVIYLLYYFPESPVGGLFRFGYASVFPVNFCLQKSKMPTYCDVPGSPCLSKKQIKYAVRFFFYVWHSKILWSLG